MKTPLVVLALACIAGSCGAIAQPSSEPATLHSRTVERYCEKLREGPREYVLFVRRLAPIHGYTYTDFVPAYPGAPLEADCRVPQERVAAVLRLLREGTA